MRSGPLPGTCGLASDRVRALGWEDRVEVVCGSIQDYDGPCDIGIGLHACGALTDMIIDFCTGRNCSFVVCPCCYGQIAGTEGAGEGQLPKSHHAVGEVLSEQEFKTVASLADYSVVDGKDGFDYAGRPEYRIARACMRVVDTDRLIHARDRFGYVVSLSRILPETCTPKNSVIIGRATAR
ncbi:hypothetical protein FOZ62_032686 [Perkinsus olseni]|uniref:Methyltransferase domain-containing protein n=1 Tax=Perkinsus olseni TaxID=32597 RepID=A0A7J6QXT6_PEROL|nr:hypothetical protein FOZ62_032686 [Perkinsus olseni]